MFGITSQVLRAARRLFAAGAALIAAQVASPAIAQSVATPGQIAVATALDSRIPTTGPSAVMRAAVVAQPTPTERASALGLLSPQSYTLLPRLVVQALDAKDMMLQSYLADRRAGTDSSPARTPGTKGGVNMVVMGDVRQAKYDAATDRPKLKSDSRSIAFAIDYQPREGVIVGAMLGIDGLDAQIDPARPRSTLFNSHIGSYASISNGRVYVTGAVSYDYADFKLRRQVGFTGFSDRLTARTDADAFAATGETGYSLALGKARVEPYAGINFRHIAMSGFTENGGAAALQVANYRTRSLQSALGLRTNATITRGAWTIRPAVQAEWRRELHGKADSRIEARFVSGNFATFTLQPTRLARDYAAMSAGVTATYKERTSLRLAYNGQLGSDRAIHGAVLSLSRRF